MQSTSFNRIGKHGYMYNPAELPYQQMRMYDDLERYEVADEDMMYQKNYGVIGDVFGKVIGLTENTVKILAKSTADNLVVPVSKHVATKIVVPVGKHVAEEIVLPVGKYVSKEIVLPVGKYVAKEIALPVGKYVAKEVALPIAKKVAIETQDIMKELTKKSIRLMGDLIEARVKQLKEDIKQEIKEMPDKIIESIKSNIKLPLGSPTKEILDERYNDTYMQNLDEFTWS